MKTFNIRTLLMAVLMILVACSPQSANDVLPTLAVLSTMTPSEIPASTATQLPIETATPAQDILEATPDLPVQAADTAISPTNTTQDLSLAATQAPVIPPLNVQAPTIIVPNEAVITFAPNASEADKAAYLESIGGQATNRVNIAGQETVIIEGVNPDALPSSPLIAASEPDYYLTAQVLTNEPDDPLFPSQWGLQMIGAPIAWLYLPTDMPMVSVAVIDSGICANHPDLQGRILPGWDFIENDNDPQDEFSHGCGVSGIIAANTNNTVGLAGAAPNTRIMPLRVLNASGVGRYSDVAAAITWAVDNGAQIINLSLGGSSPSTLLQSAVDYAVSEGVLVIAAAGNTGGDTILYPAAYANVIAVGSVDDTGSPSSFSSTNSNIALWAPGRSIQTTNVGVPEYAPMTGTSFAAPHVSAVAALEIALGRSLNVGGGLVAFGGAPFSVGKPDGTEVVQVPTNTPTIVTPAASIDIDFEFAQVNIDLRPVIQDALLRELENLPPHTRFTVSAVREEDDWFDITIVPTYIIESGWEAFNTEEVRFVIANRQVSGQILAYLEGGNDLLALSLSVPEKFIAPLPEAGSMSAGHSFPWTGGQRWIVTNNWHQDYDTSTTFNAVDFAPYEGASDTVLASQAGTVRLACAANDPNQTMLMINHGDGQSGYLHIATNSIPSGVIGYSVAKGTVIGNIYNAYNYSTPCGRGTGPHLHYVFPTRNMMMDGHNANTIGYSAVTPYVSLNTGGSTSTTSWNFASPNGAQGWTPISGLGTAVQHNEGIWFAVLGNDPYLHSPILTGVPAANYSHINIVMASQTDTCGQLYFRRQGDSNFAESRVVNFTVNPNGGTNTYRIDMRTSANWNGNIVQIRLDPACRAVGNKAVRIDRVDFFSYPGKPTITSPANSAIVSNPVTVTIQRGSLNATGRYNFNVEVATSSTFGASVVYQSGWAAENRTSFQLPTLANGIYYVRAQQGDTDYWSGPWSNTISFSIGLVVPSNLTASITVPRRIDLNWLDNSSIETGFRIERRQVADAKGIAVNGTWTQIGIAPTNANTYQDQTGLVCSARYEYRARAEAGTTLSDYSNIASILVECKAPSTPRITTPVNNSFINDATPTLEWQAVIEAYAYRVQVASDSRFRNIIAQYDGTQTSFTLLNALTNGLHFWRVQGYNSIGSSKWTTGRFTVDTIAPSVPVQTQLPNNSQTDNQRPTFRWTAVRDEASNPVTYEVRLDTSNPPVSIYENRSTSFRPATPLLVGRTYYWQVRTLDRAGNASAWSPVWSVFIDASSRAVPLRWRYNTTTPTLRWTRISWATAYEIQVDNDSRFRSLEYSSNNRTNPTTGHPSVITTSLPAGVYYWRVRAQRSDGTWSAWSAVDSFYIE